MPATKSRDWPRWWQLDDWLLLAVLVPTGSLLRWARRIPVKSLRLAVTALVVLIVVILVVLLVIAIGGG